MRQELVELCYKNMHTDGIYALALAVLMGKGRTPNANTKRVELKTTEEIEMRRQVKSWLHETATDRFCVLEIWVDCLGKPQSDYNIAAANKIRRVIDSIEGTSRIGPYLTKRFGTQRLFQYIRPRPTDAADTADYSAFEELDNISVDLDDILDLDGDLSK